MVYDDYDEEVTDASFEILKEFLKETERIGIKPIIIGGWAVEAYKKSKGSKDIDIVVNSSDIDKLLSTSFFKDEENQFDEVNQGWPLRHEKEINVNGKNKIVICDVFNSDVERQDYEHVGVKFHWNLIPQFQEERKIRDQLMLVPKIELLIITKVIAALDRRRKLDRTGSEELKSKIWKDYYDIAVLIKVNQVMDDDFMKEYIEKTKLGPHMRKFMAMYDEPEYQEFLPEIGITISEIESALSK